MLGDIGLTELLVIFVIAFILFGGSKLLEIGGHIGATIREFKKALRNEQGSPGQPIKTAPTEASDGK